MTNGFVVYENEEYLEENMYPVIKQEPQSDEELPGDLPMNCILCLKNFNTLSGLKAHVITHHNYKSVKRKSSSSASPAKVYAPPKYNCKICKRKFTTSTDLKVHQVVHDIIPCFLCDAKFYTFLDLSRHQVRCKKKVEVVKPKTLRDILDERLAQKQSFEQLKLDVRSDNKNSPPNTPEITKKDKPRETVEIEIDIKKEVTNEFPAVNNEIKIKTEIECNEFARVDNEMKIKTEIDYNRIETELEGMFKNVCENDVMTAVKLPEDQENEKTDGNQLRKEIVCRRSEKEVDDKSKEDIIGKDEVSNTVIDNEKEITNTNTAFENSDHTKQSEQTKDDKLNSVIDEEGNMHSNVSKTTSENHKDNKEETGINLATELNSELSKNVELEQNYHDMKNNSSDLEKPANNNKTDIDTTDNNNKDKNIDINPASEISNCKSVNEECHSNGETESVMQSNQ